MGWFWPCGGDAGQSKYSPQTLRVLCHWLLHYSPGGHPGILGIHLPLPAVRMPRSSHDSWAGRRCWRPPGLIDSRLPHSAARLFWRYCVHSRSPGDGPAREREWQPAQLSSDRTYASTELLGRIKVLLACALWTQFVDTSVSLFSPPNHKPQTWFHELTHGTGRHRDDRPYVVTRPNPTLSVQPRTPFPSLHRPQRTTRSGRPGLAILGFHFAERPSLGPRKFSLGREGGGHSTLRSCCSRYLHPSAPGD